MDGMLGLADSRTARLTGEQADGRAAAGRQGAALVSLTASRWQSCRSRRWRRDIALLVVGRGQSRMVAVQEQGP
jgi:hypothetical protein